MLIRESTAGFEKYQLDTATRPIAGFIDDLSVWYLRRSRDRFKEEGKDKQEALATLRFVLHRLALVMAPTAPFFAEHVFQAVREGEDEESVHLATWPEVSSQPTYWTKLFGGDKSRAMLDMMESARHIVTQALEARDKAGIKVRQPLASLLIPAAAKLSEEYFSIIADEVNVKKVQRSGNAVVLDINISENLRREGIVRDIKRLLQGARRTAKLLPNDLAKKALIRVTPSDADVLKGAVKELQEFARVEEIEIHGSDEILVPGVEIDV